MSYDFTTFAYDRDFDFMQGALPDAVVYSFLDVVLRARKVLQGRDSRQVDSIIQALNYYLAVGNRLMFIESNATEEDYPISRAKALKFAQRAMPAEDLPDVPHLSWAEIFAALAFAYVVEHLYELSCPELEQLLEMERRETQGRITVEMQQQRALALLGSQVSEAADAVGFAEQLQRESALLAEAKEQVAQEIQKLNQKRAAAGGAGRASKYEPLKQRVCEIYEAKYRIRSKRRAAKLIVKYDLTEDELRLFTTDEPQNTIADWLAEYEKTQISKH